MLNVSSCWQTLQYQCSRVLIYVAFGATGWYQPRGAVAEPRVALGHRGPAVVEGTWLGTAGQG